jgi:hypothetical protein
VSAASILFLDVDGVLVTPRSGLAHGGPEPFDREACLILDRLCSLAGARIVVSSTWREEQTRETFAALLERHDLSPSLLHEDWATPILRTNRQREIDSWLREHPEVTNWVVLDDGVGLDQDSPRLVQTDCDDGIRFRDVLALCALLGVDAEEWCRRAGVKFTQGDRAMMDAVAARLDADRSRIQRILSASIKRSPYVFITNTFESTEVPKSAEDLRVPPERILELIGSCLSGCPLVSSQYALVFAFSARGLKGESPDAATGIAQLVAHSEIPPTFGDTFEEHVRKVLLAFRKHEIPTLSFGTSKGAELNRWVTKSDLFSLSRPREDFDFAILSADSPTGLDPLWVGTSRPDSAELRFTDVEMGSIEKQISDIQRQLKEASLYSRNPKLVIERSARVFLQNVETFRFHSDSNSLCPDTLFESELLVLRNRVRRF